MKLVGMTYLASNLEANVTATTRDVIVIGSSLLIVAFLYIWIHRHSIGPQFAYVIAAISFVVLMTTGIGVASLKLQSDSFGRQHRTANIEFWICGTEIQLYSQPSLFTQMIGNRKFNYSHTNKQIARSGFVIDESTDATLGAFFTAIGGSVQADNILLPLDDDKTGWLMPVELQDGDPQGNMTTEFIERYVRSAKPKLLELSDGMRCPDGSTGELQLFVYEIDYDSNTYTQKKVDQPDDFVIKRSSGKQPHQCFIIEFSESREQTNKLCEPIGVRDQLRCSEFGIENFDAKTCNLQEATERGGQ